jgi:hypothetical protein
MAPCTYSCVCWLFVYAAQCKRTTQLVIRLIRQGMRTLTSNSSGDCIVCKLLLVHFW